MPRGFRGPKKQPFDELSPEFKDAARGADSTKLKEQLTEIALNEQLNLASQKADQDLKSLKDQVKDASAGYREVTKINKLKTKFIIEQLSDRGDPKSSEIVTEQKRGELNV